MKTSTLKPSDPERLAAFLGGLCLFLSTVEYLFPRPLPFFRLGLANLPILLALELLPPPWLLVLAALKIVGQALINGTLASYVLLFSAAGTLASLALMYLLYRLLGTHISLIGLGIAGALASTTAQIGLSLWLVFGPQAVIIAPYFLLLGLVTGTAIGGLASAFRTRSSWYRQLLYDRAASS